jgi:mono/diheme cytochrome c family protein
MQDQPKYKAYRAAPGGGTSMRVPPEGTVARGFLRADTALYTGKMAPTSATGAAGQPAQPADVTTFPFPITEEVMQRGQQRYQIYCSVCHGLTGAGDGMIVRRGYRIATAFTEKRLVDAPVGHYFDVITNGWGAMPSYASQIPVQDRWAIIAYVRALQRSQGGAAGTTPAANSTGATNANGNANAAPAASPAHNQAGGHE